MKHLLLITSVVLALAGSVSAQTFPTVVARVATEHAGATSHTVPLPSGCCTANDLIYVFFGHDAGTSENATCTVTGWTQLNYQQCGIATCSLLHGYFVATGSEGASITCTTDTNEVGMSTVLQLRNAGTPEAGSTANGTTGAADPPSHTPVAGSDDYLWIESAVVDHTTDTALDITGASTNYSNLTGNEGGGASGIAGYTAERNLTGTTDNPGTFTQSSTADDWAAALVAVPYSAPAATGAPTLPLLGAGPTN